MTVNYVKTIDEVTDMIRQHELEEKVKFYIYKQDGEFTNLTQPPAGIYTYHPILLFINILYTTCTNQISV